MKKIFLAVLVIVLATALVSCGASQYKTNDGSQITLSGKSVNEKPQGKSAKDTDVIRVVFEVKHFGSFVAELYPEYAPNTVRNFADLVADGFYDGVIFHRIVPSFVIQAGIGKDGAKADAIEGEFSSNGYEGNTLLHERGTISMARTQDKNSASSQFFVCLSDAPHLDGEYAAFGKVVCGMETVDKIGEVAVDGADKPFADVIIEKAYIISDAEYQKYK